MSFYVLDGISEVEGKTTLLWNIFGFVSSSSLLELQWDILNYVDNELELQWDIPEIPTVSKDVELQWYILEFVDEADLELLWDIINYDIPEYQFTTEKRTKSFM